MMKRMNEWRCLDNDRGLNEICGATIWKRDLPLLLMLPCLCYLLIGPSGFWLGLYLMGAAFTYSALMGYCWGNGSRCIALQPQRYAWTRSGLLEDYVVSILFSLLWLPAGLVVAILVSEGFRDGFRWKYPPGLWQSVKNSDRDDENY